MRIIRPVIEQVREYAEARGCTVFDEGGHRFLAPDRSRAIRISEIQPGMIYLWDTAVGNISMPRERRSTRISTSKEHGDEGAPARNEGRDENERPTPGQLSITW